MHLKGKSTLAPFLLVAFVGWYSISTSTGLVLKGTPNAHGAVELLLATGILAKLLDIRAKHGHAGAQRIMNAIIGGFRYPARHFYAHRARYHPNQIIQEEVLDPHTHAAMAFQDTNVLYDTRGVLGKTQMYIPTATRAVPIVPATQVITTDVQLMTAQLEAQQRLMAARRARKMMAAQQARKMMAQEEARKMLAAEQEAQQLLAAQRPRPYMASSKENKEMPPPQNTQTAQARALILDDDIGDLIATREFYTRSDPEIIVADTSGTHPAFLAQEDAFLALRRHDLPFFDDEYLMKYHVL